MNSTSDTAGKHSFSLRPNHCGISVPDIESGIAWYGKMLGFEVKSRMAVETLRAEIAFLSNGDFQIELFEVTDAKPLPEGARSPNLDLQTHGTKHIAFAVKDLEELVAYLKSHDADIAMDVSQMPDGKVAFIRDNAGILIELIEPGALVKRRTNG